MIFPVTWTVIAVAVSMSICCPVSALAQPEATLDAAERAFVNLDYEVASELATEALRAGGHSPEQTARLYELIATSAVLLGDEAASFEAYRRQLAIEPEASMDRSLSPALRTPFLRARGWWAGQGAPFGVRLLLGDPGRAQPLRFLLRIHDPLAMVESYRLRVRDTEGDEFQEHTGPANQQGAIQIDVPGLSDDAVEPNPYVYYALDLLDAHGNVLLSAGSDRDPSRIENPRRRIALNAETSPDTPSGLPIWEEWWFWSILAVVVAGGAALGIYFGIPPQVNGRPEFSFGI